MTTATAPLPLVAHTVAMSDPGSLLARLPTADGVAWIHGGDGLIGWGEAARLVVRGPEAFAQAEHWWRALIDECVVTDDVCVRGSGPVAFGSFGFADTDTSVVVVPETVLGRRDGVTWLTTLGNPTPTPRRRVQPPGEVSYADCSRDVIEWRSAVARARARIRSGALEKVVLALPARARAEHAVDPRWLLDRLAARYPDCWTFAVDGLVGATPELLVDRRGQTVTSRVLAGTVRRAADSEEDQRLCAALVASAKDHAEHRPALDSVVSALSTVCTDVTASPEPYVLALANVSHLASDVRACLTGHTSALELVGRLHPTAAVAGTPTDAALELIESAEPASRERYAGPVGWMDTRGDGEWCVALRCAHVRDRDVRLWAGCGIVADSDPEAEVAEWESKLVPIREALSD